MNARLRVNALRRSAEIVQLLQPVRAHPIELAPIAWGQPDRALAKGVCRHVLDATPATVIPFHPASDARLRRALRSHHIPH